MTITLTSFNWSRPKHRISPLPSVSLSAYIHLSLSLRSTLPVLPQNDILHHNLTLAEAGGTRVADVLLYRSRPDGKLHLHPPLTALSVITASHSRFAMLITPLSHIRRWMSWRLWRLQTGTRLSFRSELLRWNEGKKLICSSWQHSLEEVVGFLSASCELVWTFKGPICGNLMWL